ncbi:MAG TPA: hypothetical protein VK009_22790 [Chloroflexota bacterium]|nr:hypothetical protein [Chloroflexota bacterium]
MTAGGDCISTSISLASSVLVPTSGFTCDRSTFTPRLVHSPSESASHSGVCVPAMEVEATRSGAAPLSATLATALAAPLPARAPVEPEPPGAPADPPPHAASAPASPAKAKPAPQPRRNARREITLEAS